jgi:hypothetical protein
MFTGTSPAGLTIDASAIGAARVVACRSQGVFAPRAELLLLRLSRP